MERFDGIECLLGLNSPVLLPSALFPPISYFALILQENQHGRTPMIEQHDFFVKQSIRNRYRIVTSQGEHLLSIPLVSKSSKTLLNEIEINYEMSWQKEHYRTLTAAYSSTPYFEHYIDSLTPLFENKFTSLIELNRWTFEKIIDLLDLPISFEYSNHYYGSNSSSDYRSTRSEAFTELHSSYYQLNFDQGMAFKENLSILDLLFNQGPNSRLWLNEAIR